MGMLDKILESFLIEDAALTKGSQRVMNDKKLVAALADAVRDDAQSNPPAFPPGSKNNFKKASDEAVAHWFLENIDRIEREGYDDVIYSRDGVNSDWIVRRYIAGSHSWEDLTGVMNMNLNDWYQLKNRNMLDANHKDLPKFNSVRDLGYYMTTHYKNQLDSVRDAAKNAARNKKQKNVKLVDNKDYRIYTTLNRAAGCALGLGTQWCTANSKYDGHFHSYSKNAMLFQMFPYTDKKSEDGKPLLSEDEKYQFDAGGPNFMDATDRPANAENIRTRYPYIFSDLTKALHANKSKFEKTFAELSADPSMQEPDFKIKTYEIDEEIQKLHKFLGKYFTEEERPSKSADAAVGDIPQVGDAPATSPEQQQEQPPQEQQMESTRKLKEFAPSMPPKQPPKGPADDYWGDDANDDGDHPVNYFYLTKSYVKTISNMFKEISNPDNNYDDEDYSSTVEKYRNIPQIKKLAEIFQDGGIGAGLKYFLTLPDSVQEGLGLLWDGHGLEWEDDCKKFGINESAKTIKQLAQTMLEEVTLGHIVRQFKPIGAEDSESPLTHGDELEELSNDPTDAYDQFEEAEMDTQLTDPQDELAAGTMQQPSNTMQGGRAPTMPESVINQGNMMENVDKDVAAMINSLKKYDKLTEGVIGMATMAMVRPQVVEAGKPWEADSDEDKKEKEVVGAKSKTSKGGTVTKTDKGLTHKGTYGSDKKAEKVEESTEVDPEILNWMDRFSKLGNMKGYGR
jgi:hypothetical protein